MFDHVLSPEDAVYYARRASLLDAVDETDVLDPALDAPLPLDTDLAPDPAADLVSAVSDAQVCAGVADAATALTPEMLARLAAVDVDALDGVAAVDAAISFDRVANWVAARRVAAVATAVHRQVGTERVDPVALACSELQAALRVGSVTINREVTVALELTVRLPRTLAAMQTGALSYGKARLLAEQTLDLVAEHATAVEDLVLDAAAGRTWAQHEAAVRRAVVRVDPQAPERRRNNADRAARVLRRYGNDGLAELIVTLPVAAVDAAYTAADGWARARKAAGDPRTLDVLRAEAFARWASSYLTHGDATGCDRICDPVPSPTPSPPADVDTATGEIHDPSTTVESAPAGDVEPRPSRRTPMRHGRPLRVGLVWDLESLLGLADAPGELLDSGEVIAAADMRGLVAAGIRIRRMLIDPHTGGLVDLTPGSWLLDPDPHAPTSTPGHGQPMWLGIVIDTTTWQGWADGTLRGVLATAITLAPRSVREMLAAPRTDHTLDDDPDAEQPSPALAEFIAVRDRHPTNPTAAPTAAGAGDADHIRPRSAGGQTTRANLHSPTRRWHLLRTHTRWRIHPNPTGGWTWTSPHGRTYTLRPHDYRRGP